MDGETHPIMRALYLVLCCGLLISTALPTAALNADERLECCLQLRDGDVSAECTAMTLGECVEPLRAWDEAKRAELALGVSENTRFLGSMIAYMLLGLIVFWIVHHFIERNRRDSD